MVHRTMQGRVIDMEKLARANELMPAIGNLNVNARGDELGPGGQIARRREEVVAEYYQDTPKPAPTVATQAVAPQAQAPSPVVAEESAAQKKKVQDKE